MVSGITAPRTFEVEVLHVVLEDLLEGQIFKEQWVYNLRTIPLASHCNHRGGGRSCDRTCDFVIE